MLKQQTIKCAFCQGTGANPHFTGSCPVCKGRGNNQVIGKFMACSDCHGSGQKRGTTLVCWTCGGLGVVPDRREEFKKARKAIKKAQEEMEIEKEEFREKPLTKKAKLRDEEDPVEESDEDSRFCQCCAKKVNRASTVKVCLKCFRKLKEL